MMVLRKLAVPACSRNDMCSNLRGHGAIAEACRDGFRRTFGDMVEERRVPILDLVSQWRALTIRDGGMARRRRGAGFLQRDDRDLGKPGFAQLIPEQFHVVITVRGSREKTRRVIGEYGGRRFRHDMSEFVGLDMIPDTEEQAATWFEDPPCLGITGNSVGKNMTPN